MTWEEFETAAPKKLREEAKSRYDEANANPSWGGAATYLLQAQFYMQEAERRHSNRIEDRDYKLEIWVIVLIGFEILLSLVGLGLGWKEAADEAAMMNEQNTILTTLQTTTQTTADQMKEQLAMESRIVINPQLSAAGDLTVYNNSRSEILLWGVKVGKRQATLSRVGPMTIPVGIPVKLNAHSEGKPNGQHHFPSISI